MSDLYKASDYVDVVDEVTGEPHPHKIPKAWLGTEFALGLKKAGKKSSDSSGSSTPDEPVEIPDGDPHDKWNVKQLDAYAQREDIDLSSAGSKAEKLTAIAKAKATPVTGD